jgi:hypothetical protein
MFGRVVLLEDRAGKETGSVSTRKHKALRESIQNLVEYMYGSSAYPGPEPGKLWSLGLPGMGNPAGQIYADPRAMEKAKRDEEKRKKKADFRAHLRKMALWQAQKGTQ